MKCDNYISVEFPSKSANEALARGIVATFAAQLDPTIEELGDIKTAVSEAVTNCIVHAYPNGIGIIRLKCKILNDKTLEILIKDNGIGIADIEQAMKPMYTTGGPERSGMGFVIMESFMNTISVQSRSGKGTTVRMRRKVNRRI